MRVGWWWWCKRSSKIKLRFSNTLRLTSTAFMMRVRSQCNSIEYIFSEPFADWIEYIHHVTYTNLMVTAWWVKCRSCGASDLNYSRNLSFDYIKPKVDDLKCIFMGDGTVYFSPIRSIAISLADQSNAMQSIFFNQ